jgi:hypothetical protein
MFGELKVLNALSSFPLFSSISMLSIMKTVLVPSFVSLVKLPYLTLFLAELQLSHSWLVFPLH